VETDLNNNLVNTIYDYFGYQGFRNCCKDLLIDATVAKHASSRALKNIVFDKFHDETLMV